MLLSHKKKKVPSTKTGKADIVTWLQKNVYSIKDPTNVVLELLYNVKQKEKYKSYGLD